MKKEGPVVDLVLHWQGGDHTALQLKLRLNAAGRHHSRVPEDAIALVRELARLMPDAQIARLLNRSGKPTGHGNGWTEQRVRGFRTTTKSRATGTANGPNAARSRSRPRRRSLVCTR